MRLGPAAIVIGVMVTTAITRSVAPHAATPQASSTERFDTRVRADFFDGFAGDRVAFERAMALCERTLKDNPKHPEALVWHGSGLLFRAGEAFGAGNAQEGERLWARGLGEMDEAVELAPDSVGVLIPRGATLLETSRYAPPELARPLLERAVGDYTKVRALQEPIFATLSAHARGELLFGLAEGLYRLGETDKARRYFQSVLDEAGGSGRTAHARAFLAGERPAQLRCVGCH